MKISNIATEESSTSQEQSQFPNWMAKKWALDKVKKAMPSTPRKKANIFLEMSNSPRTREILVKKGAMQTPEDQKKVETSRAVAQDLNEGLNTIKSHKSTFGRAAYTAAKSLAFGDNVKNKRSTTQCQNYFN